MKQECIGDDDHIEKDDEQWQECFDQYCKQGENKGRKVVCPECWCKIGKRRYCKMCFLRNDFDNFGDNEEYKNQPKNEETIKRTGGIKIKYD